MISILLMTVFSETDSTDPMVFKQGAATTHFARVGPMDALASVSNKVGDVDKRAEIAQTYIDALRTAKNADAIQEETVNDSVIGTFKIANFKIDENHALLKFWKILETGTKTVLTCVIDRASVGLKKTEDVTAKMIKASWLNYFWNLWDNKKIFAKASFTPSTQRNIDTLAGDKEKGNGQAFADIKGLTPRYFKNLSKNEILLAKKKEMNSLIPTLLRMNRMGIDIPEIVTKFRTKIWGLLEKLNTENPGILDNFASDDEPSQLQLKFWEVFWDNTMVKIVSDGLTQENADNLTAQSLAAIDELADQYKAS